MFDRSAQHILDYERKSSFHLVVKCVYKNITKYKKKTITYATLT